MARAAARPLCPSRIAESACVSLVMHQSNASVRLGHPTDDSPKIVDRDQEVEVGSWLSPARPLVRECRPFSQVTPFSSGWPQCLHR